MQYSYNLPSNKAGFPNTIISNENDLKYMVVSNWGTVFIQYWRRRWNQKSYQKHMYHRINN